jgi:hypothetical protein
VAAARMRGNLYSSKGITVHYKDKVQAFLQAATARTKQNHIAASLAVYKTTARGLRTHTSSYYELPQGLQHRRKGRRRTS